MLRPTFCVASLALACSLSAQVEPNAGQWKTWVIASGRAMRLQPPPDSDTTAAEIQSIKDSASQLDSAALARIRYWDAGAPAYRWMQMAQQLAVSALRRGVSGRSPCRLHAGCRRR